MVLSVKVKRLAVAARAQRIGGAYCLREQQRRNTFHVFGVIATRSGCGRLKLPVHQVSRVGSTVSDESPAVEMMFAVVLAVYSFA